MVRGKVKYVTVRDDLRKRIAEMEPGDRLPTEPQLCGEYGVSRITVRTAVDDLIQQGLVVREQGRGTFVAEPRPIHERFADRITGFHRQQTELGREVTTKVLNLSVGRDADAAAALMLPAHDELIILERLRYVDGTLHQHVMTYLPAARYPAVLAHDFSHDSLYDFLASAYGVHLAANDVTVRLETADESLATHLGMEEGEVILAIDSTVYDTARSPVAFGTAQHTRASSELAFTLRDQIA